MDHAGTALMTDGAVIHAGWDNTVPASACPLTAALLCYKTQKGRPVGLVALRNTGLFLC